MDWRRHILDGCWAKYSEVRELEPMIGSMKI